MSTAFHSKYWAHELMLRGAIIHFGQLEPKQTADAVRRHALRRDPPVNRVLGYAEVGRNLVNAHPSFSWCHTSPAYPYQ